MTVNTNLSKMKNKILPTCLQGNYRDSLGEFSNTSYGVFEAEMRGLRERGGEEEVSPQRAVPTLEAVERFVFWFQKKIIPEWRQLIYIFCAN